MEVFDDGTSKAAHDCAMMKFKKIAYSLTLDRTKWGKHLYTHFSPPLEELLKIINKPFG
jgi:hypothetical protein